MNYNPTVAELQSMTLAELIIVACKKLGRDDLLQKLFDMAEKHKKMRGVRSKKENLRGSGLPQTPGETCRL